MDQICILGCMSPIVLSQIYTRCSKFVMILLCFTTSSVYWNPSRLWVISMLYHWCTNSDTSLTNMDNIMTSSNGKFSALWPFVRGIHQSPVNSPHTGQWRGALMCSFICVWINGWVNNREAGDLRRYRAYYDVIVMKWITWINVELIDKTKFPRWD